MPLFKPKITLYEFCIVTAAGCPAYLGYAIEMIQGYQRIECKKINCLALFYSSTNSPYFTIPQYRSIFRQYRSRSTAPASVNPLFEKLNGSLFRVSLREINRFK